MPLLGILLIVSLYLDKMFDTQKEIVLTTHPGLRVHVLQHVASEGVGSMREWFHSKDAVIHTTRVDLNQPLPDLNDIDWLIVMGGPMSVYQEEEHPWLIEEKRFIRAAIDANIRVLGICLGAQLIANAMGAKVYKNTQQEIGWFPIQKTHDIATWLPDTATLLCWHGDCFDLPEGATSFATSAITSSQGFCLNPRVWALQFHLEAKTGTTDVFFRVTGASLPAGDYVQSLEELACEDHLEHSKQTIFGLLNYMFSH